MLIIDFYYSINRLKTNTSNSAFLFLSLFTVQQFELLDIIVSILFNAAKSSYQRNTSKLERFEHRNP